MTLVGYCGDDCEWCPRYVATRDNDVEGLKRAALLWARVGMNESLVPAEEMICNGCASLEQCHYDDVRECARGRGISNCGRCDEYPCDRINQVFERTGSYARQCKEVCDAEDYACLHKAFFSKKDRLDAVHNRYMSGAGTGD
jgi:hypothetical protein